MKVTNLQLIANITFRDDDDPLEQGNMNFEILTAPEGIAPTVQQLKIACDLINQSFDSVITEVTNGPKSISGNPNN